MIFTLAAVAMLAGFVDAIAGGGGLITLPALFLAGIIPQLRLLPINFNQPLLQYPQHSHLRVKA
jgi:uncharacterized membrane protein YfcA